MMFKLFDKLTWLHLGGLGDHFVLNAIALRYAKQCHKFYVPVHTLSYATVKSLYKDVPNIEVIGVPGGLAAHETYRQFIKDNNIATLNYPPMQYTRLWYPGMSKEELTIVNWERQIYEAFDLPFSERYSGFRLPKHIDGEEELFEKETQGETRYALVHSATSETGELGFDLNVGRRPDDLPLKVIYTKSDIDLLQYVKLIRNATEIHVASSSFYCLVESLGELPAKLFFHELRHSHFSQENSFLNGFKWRKVIYPYGK